MTIGRNILNLTTPELAQFVAQRRSMRALQKSVKTMKTRRKTVSQLAKELGIDKHKVLEALNE